MFGLTTATPTNATRTSLSLRLYLRNSEPTRAQGFLFLAIFSLLLVPRFVAKSLREHTLLKREVVLRAEQTANEVVLSMSRAS